ncbi:MAG TPA: lysophospholipid acyltransferase family protein [Nitrospirota bacterium]
MAKGTHSYHLDRYSVYWWISWGARHIPKPLSNFIGDRIADWLYYRKSGSIVGEQVKNLDRILGPDVSVAAKREVVRRLWRLHGRFLLEHFRFENMSDAEIARLVPEFKGVEHIRKALDKGRGAVILTAHIGHWELGAILLKYLGFDVSVVQQLYDSGEQNVILDKGKQVRGINVIPSSGNPVGFAVSTHNMLKANGLVAFQGDRDPDKKGIPAEFFGSPAYFPVGPVVLAMKTGAPLVPAFTIMGDDGLYYPVAEPEIPMTDTGDLDADIRANVSKTTEIIEKYVRMHPEQWFNFYSFWE